MTNDQDTTCDESFLVVLIDLQKAANKDIHCVKRPLTEDLKFVAISYRWGELQETSINTQVGYVASITSFDLQDFFQLCEAVTKEPTMASMEYVWVDAICVNQSDHDERKSTIYHMSEIYEQASWILAVPDLHAQHLRTMTNNERDMTCIEEHQRYLYHLVHGHIDELRKMDQAFLDAIGVPQDPNLRHLLINYTDCFADRFMASRVPDLFYDDERTLYHLYETHRDASTDQVSTCELLSYFPGELETIQPLHQCKNGMDCPLPDISLTYLLRRREKEWHRDIIGRSTAIRQSMHFLTDLVVDWSSRVWVISEFHISKKKNNLKFWFIQLNGDHVTEFYNFDVDDPFQSKAMEQLGFHIGQKLGASLVYYHFYARLFSQLNKQAFLEMMLKSKASKNEDRFYSIFPLFPEYKQLLQNNKELVSDVNSLLSVKLKLYQVMTNEHKLWLFQLLVQGKPTWTLPTFATSVIHSPYYSFSHLAPVNLGITLLREKGGLYYLRLKPEWWAISRNADCTNAAARRVLAQLGHITCMDPTKVDLIFSDALFLIGSANENTWIVGTQDDVEIKNDFEIEHFPSGFLGFHVY